MALRYAVSGARYRQGAILSIAEFFILQLKWLCGLWRVGQISMRLLSALILSLRT